MKTIKNKLNIVKYFILLFVLFIGLQSSVYAQLITRVATPAERAILSAALVLQIPTMAVGTNNYIAEKVTIKKGIEHTEYNYLHYHVIPTPAPIPNLEGVIPANLLSYWEVVFDAAGFLIWKNQSGAHNVTADSGVAGGIGGAVPGAIAVPVPGGRTKFLYVMDLNGRMYIHQELPHVAEKTKFGHPAFLGGGPVAGAGEISVHNGVIQWISNVSGHYRPSTTSTYQVLAWLGIMHTFPNFNGIVPPSAVAGFPSFNLTKEQVVAAQVFIDSFQKHIVLNELVGH